MLERYARWRWGSATATNVVLCVLGFALMMMARQFVSETDHFTIGFSGASGWSAIVYLAALAVVLTQPTNRWTIWIVLVWALLQQWMTLFEPPYLSSDIYRYVWDGVVQHAGINPYRYVPGDKALTFLREPYADLWNNMNRRDYARTIYPPIAQMVYWLSTFMSPTVQGMKWTMFLFECGTCAGLVAMLKRMGRPAAEVLVYAWCPLLVWEIAGAGHVDAAVFFFIAMALLFRFRGQDAWVGLFLGLAVMTKFYPLVLFPALWRRGDWKMPAVLVSVVAVGYAMYLSVGKLVVGFLFEYQKEEGMDTGARYFLLAWANAHGMHVGPGAYKVFCVAVFAGLTWWCWKYATRESLPGIPQWLKPGSASGVDGRDRAVRLRVPAFVRGTLMLAMALMLLFSPHYPWYLAWLIPLMALDVNWVTVTYVCAFFYGYTTMWADGTAAHSLLLNGWIYLAVLCAALLQVAWSRLGLRRWMECREAAR